jgi:hypothetical protein
VLHRSVSWSILSVCRRLGLREENVVAHLASCYKMDVRVLPIRILEGGWDWQF